MKNLIELTQFLNTNLEIKWFKFENVASLKACPIFFYTYIKNNA